MMQKLRVRVCGIEGGGPDWRRLGIGAMPGAGDYAGGVRGGQRVSGAQRARARALHQSARRHRSRRFTSRPEGPLAERSGLLVIRSAGEYLRPNVRARKAMDYWFPLLAVVFGPGRNLGSAGRHFGEAL